MPWSDTNYVTIYNMKRSGLNDRQAADVLGVTVKKMRVWLRNNDAFRKAYDEGVQDTLDAKLNHLTVNQRTFIMTYSKCGNVKKTEDLTGVCRQSHYRWMREDPEYAEAFEHAHETAIDELEWEARRRAFHGVQKMKFYNGQPIVIPTTPDDPDGMRIEKKGKNGKPDRVEYVKFYIEHEYSDRLMIELLRAKRPGQYRPEKSDVNITNVNSSNVVTLEQLVEDLEESNVIDSGKIEELADQQLLNGPGFHTSHQTATSRKPGSNRK